MNIYEINPSNQVFWWDFGKTVLGTFVGASLAFIANLRIQYLQRRSARLTAGNHALAVLSKMYGDFLIARAGAREDNVNRAAWPTWARCRPTMLQFTERLQFDTRELAFLAEEGQQEILRSLFLTETDYHDLRQILEENSETCYDRDARIAAAGLGEFTIADLHKIEIIIGPAMRAKLDAHYHGLMRRIETYAEFYRRSGVDLHGFMIKKFDKSKVMDFRALGVRPEIAAQE